jgi:hypothetical protein
MTNCKLGGYIYKWGEKIGLSDHFIAKDKGSVIFDASKSYPVTDESFLYDDPFSVIGRGFIKLDDEGVWADITINSEPYAEALLDPEKGEKFKLGFMVMNKKMDKETGEITKGYLMGIDVSEIGMEEIEYVHD